MAYGVVPTGFSRKPLAVILAEIEAKNETEFGSQVIQTPQSPLGQINGLMADLISELWEQLEDVYQSYDPKQAENARLDQLARLRLIQRNGLTDLALRQAITNLGQARVDLQDMAQAIRNIPGVTFVQIFVNETGEFTVEGLELGMVAVAVVGGDDAVLAETLRLYIAPGVNTFGNTRVTSNVDGFCRSISVIRPIFVPVDLVVKVRRVNDKLGCPPPSTLAIKQTLEAEWINTRFNGLDPSFYTVRSIIEREFENVEVLTVTGERDGITYLTNQPVPIAFVEIATITAEIDSE